jgi:hypothetical protein
MLSSPRDFHFAAHAFFPTFFGYFSQNSSKRDAIACVLVAEMEEEEEEEEEGGDTPDTLGILSGVSPDTLGILSGDIFERFRRVLSFHRPRIFFMANTFSVITG